MAGEVLLHACCAPCSSAIVEWLMAHDLRPTIFYFNPNIFPAREYEIRKEESKRHAETLGLRWIDGDYDHASWLEAMKGLEHEPERGRRCEACFAYRMLATAHMAQPPLFLINLVFLFIRHNRPPCLSSRIGYSHLLNARSV